VLGVGLVAEVEVLSGHRLAALLVPLFLTGRDEAARELRRLGRRVGARRRRATGGPGLASLSGREREIAELVARGHPNREIAAQLFLSEKTIESHLSKVFAKLGVSRRVAVAETVGRERDPED
jgi:DNA-binding CsgD family transcriptional regulator